MSCCRHDSFVSQEPISGHLSDPSAAGQKQARGSRPTAGAAGGSAPDLLGAAGLQVSRECQALPIPTYSQTQKSSSLVTIPTGLHAWLVDFSG